MPYGSKTSYGGGQMNTISKGTVCRRCKKEKPLSNFGTSNTFRSSGNPNDPKSRGDTKIYRWRICNPCRSKTKIPDSLKKLYEAQSPLVPPQ